MTLAAGTRWALGLGVASAAASLAFACPASAQLTIAERESQEQGEQILKTVRIDQRLNSEIPRDIRFQDESGRDVTMGSYLGEKPLMLVMIQYRCTMLCTEQLNVLMESLRKLAFTPGKEFNLVIASIDPREKPDLAFEKKKSHLEVYGRASEAGWHFITGDKENIDRLAEAVGYHYVYDARSDQYAHPDGVILITPSGKVTRYFSRLHYPAGDLRLGLVEAAGNKIGSPIDLITLLCYHYNPVTGRYGLATLNLVRFGAICTVTALGLSILLMRRRDRAARRGVGNAALEAPAGPGTKAEI